MNQKNLLRKKYCHLRKKNYYEIDQKFFFPLIKLIKSKFKKKNLRLALYYPSNFELNVLKVLDNNYIKNKNILLPIIESKDNMNFYSWEKNQALFVNKFGMLEPRKTKIKIPHFILIPVLAFDKYKYRLGYGKGFYDNFLSLCKTNTIKVGLSFFDPVDKIIDIRSEDIKMDFCVNPEGIKKFTS